MQTVGMLGLPTASTAARSALGELVVKTKSG